jgi:hypothetical protein
LTGEVPVARWYELRRTEGVPWDLLNREREL